MAKERQKISLRRASILITTLLVVFLLLDVAIVLFSSQALLTRHRESSVESMLQVYSGTLDNRLRIMTSYVNHLLTNNEDIRQLGAEQSARERFVTRRGVSTVLSTLLQLEPLADGAACWRGDEIVSVNNASDMEANTEIRNTLVRLAEEKNSPLVNSGWNWTSISGLWYLVNITRSQSTCCAVWMRDQIIASLVPNTDHSKDSFEFYFQQGDQLIGTGVRDRTDAHSSFATATRTSAEGSFDYCCHMVGEVGDVSSRVLMIAMICLSTTVLITALLSLLHHLVQRMLKEIQAGLVTRSENLSCQLPTARIMETDQVYQTLNDMSEKILHLQSNIYLHEINEQKSRLQILHMQINSHFFSNCMNIIFSLAQVQKYPLIQDFCIYLIDYLKYINTAFQTYTPLEDELVHLENYLMLQQMRYPNRVVWHINADAQARAFPILPLILLTFIENIFKHAIIDEQMCIIQIQAESGQWDGQQGLKIRIEDNGEGISEERAAYLNAFDFSKNAEISNDKSGIEKTLARIQLFYGDKATFHIGRNTHNRRTVIQLFFPAQKENDRRQ